MALRTTGRTWHFPSEVDTPGSLRMGQDLTMVLRSSPWFLCLGHFGVKAGRSVESRATNTWARDWVGDLGVGSRPCRLRQQ